MRRGIHVCKAVLIFVSVLVAVTSVSAHDVWITVEQDPTGALRAMVHHGHPGDRKTPDRDKLFEFNLLAEGHSRRSLLPGITSASQGSIPVLITEPLAIENGFVLLTARYDNGYWVKTPNGFRNTSKRQMPDAEDSLYSMKFAKAMVQTGPITSDAYKRVIGHQLELVPLMNPFSMGPGSILKVRVYFDGRPLVGVEVEHGDGITPMEEKDIPRSKTDAEGVVIVPIIKLGPQLFVVDYILPSTHPDLAVREFYNATLSFILTADATTWEVKR
jgi:nickel transport protein